MSEQMKNLLLCLLVASVVSCGFDPLTAQEKRTVVAEGSAIFSPDLTLAEVKEKARADAFARAIAEVAGVTIQSEIFRQTSEVLGEKNTLDEIFSVVNRAVSYGRVVEPEVLDETIENRERSDGTKEAVVRVRVRCTVVRDEESPDPAFTLSAGLNKDVFFAGTDDEVIVSLECSQDAFLTLFGISNDTVTVLLPNELVNDNRLISGEKLEFPSRRLRSQGVHLRAKVPAGRVRMAEAVLAVATKDPVQFRGGKIVGGFGLVATYKSAVDELNQWLSQIPPSRRTATMVQYEVRKR